MYWTVPAGSELSECSGVLKLEQPYFVNSAGPMQLLVDFRDAAPNTAALLTDLGTEA